MLQVNGTLTVKKIHGAKGAFSVGDLVTEVGTFKIKDALLDQFEEGRYQGTFAISSIYLSSYIWRGKSMTDTLRARERVTTFYSSELEILEEDAS